MLTWILYAFPLYSGDLLRLLRQARRDKNEGFMRGEAIAVFVDPEKEREEKTIRNNLAHSGTVQYRYNGVQ